MANLGSAYISLYPEMNGFEAKIQSALSGINVSGIADKLGDELGDGISGGFDKASSSTSGFSGKLSTLTGVVAGVASSIAGKLIDSIVDLGGQMVEAADSSQKFASTLSFAGIDTSTIEKLTASTQKYADETVYDLADIRNVTAQLAANGVDNYAQLAEAAGNLNAVAGGTSDTFKSVGMVMTQTAGAGKLTTENWNQLTDAIPGASGALQEAMASAGAFEGNFRDAMEKGEISADEFFAAVQKLGMQDVAVQAATSTSTIEGALGNLQASVVGVGSQVITALNPIITGSMSMLAEAISGIPSAFIAITPLLAPIATAFQQAFGTIGPAVQQAVNVIGPLLMPLLAQLAGVVQGLAPMVAMVAQTVISGATQILSVVMPILTQLLGWINANMPLIQSVVGTVMTGIQQFVTIAMTGISQIWNAVWPALDAVATAVMAVIAAVVSGDMSGIQSIIDSVLGTIQSVWSGAWETIKSTLSSAWDNISSGVRSGIDAVLDFFRKLPGNIVSALGNLGSLLLSAGGDIINGLINGIKNNIGRVADTLLGGIKNAVSGVLGFLGIASPSKLFKSIGGYTMEGLAIGIDRAADLPVKSMASVMSDMSSIAPNAGLSTWSASSLQSSGVSGQGDAMGAVVYLLSQLPGIISGNVPNALSLDGRTFGQLVRRYQTV